TPPASRSLISFASLTWAGKISSRKEEQASRGERSLSAEQPMRFRFCRLPSCTRDERSSRLEAYSRLSFVKALKCVKVERSVIALQKVKPASFRCGQFFRRERSSASTVTWSVSRLLKPASGVRSVTLRHRERSSLLSLLKPASGERSLTLL